MLTTLRSFVVVIATIASISSWAGGYIEPTGHGFKVVFFSQHASARESVSRGCHIAWFTAESAVCAVSV